MDKRDVFISYSSRDKTIAEGVCAQLESRRLKCWIAPRDITPGANWGEAILDGIDRCRTFVIILSSDANSSQQIHREIERAVNRNLPVLPFRIQDVAPSRQLEYFLSSSHWLDAWIPPLDRHVDRLAAAVRTLLQSGAQPAAATQPTALPLPTPRWTPRRERRLGWWIGVAALVVALVGAIGGGVAWYQSAAAKERANQSLKAAAVNTQRYIESNYRSLVEVDLWQAVPHPYDARRQDVYRSLRVEDPKVNDTGKQMEMLVEGTVEIISMGSVKEHRFRLKHVYNKLEFGNPYRTVSDMKFWSEKDQDFTQSLPE